MVTTTLPFLYVIISISVAYGNECLFPATWTESSWMTDVIDMSKDVNLIKYGFDKSCYTAKSTAPKVKTQQYNCPAYSQEAGGNQVYLRAEIGKQYTSNGLCISQRRLENILIRREAGIQPHIDACKAALPDVSLYSILLPVDPYKSDGDQFAYRTTWAISTEVNCPMAGMHKVVCKTTGNDVCPLDSAVMIEGATMSILVPKIASKYQNLPLTGSIKCLADLSASDIGEPATNDRVLALKWNTNLQPNRVHFFCVRYRRLNNGTWSLSIDVEDTSRIECQRYAKHDWQGAHGTPPREYFKLLLIPQNTASTTRGSTTPGISTTTKLITTRMTTKTTTIPKIPVLHHLQVMIGAPYNVYAADDEKAELLKADLKSSIVQICGISHQSIEGVHMEVGKSGEIMTTFDVKEIKTTMDSCNQKLIDFIDKGGDITHGKVLMPVKKNVYLWRDDSKCPDIFCVTGSYCWIRQGDYTCECSNSSQNSAGVCSPTGVSEQSAEDDKRVITYAVIGAAAFLVMTALIVIVIVVIRRRQGDKDLASDKDSIGTLEQQDRDMYSSIGKKPRAYHDKQFIVTDDDEYTGEKTGIQNSGYK